MRIVPYRGRKLAYRAPAWVYRNLHLIDGPWYTIMQNQVVIGHAREVAIRDAEFIVRPGGRARVLATRRKNVHAFVVGTVTHVRPTETEFGPPHDGRYRPYEAGTFEYLDGQEWRPVAGARAAYLGPDGLLVFGPVGPTE